MSSLSSLDLTLQTNGMDSLKRASRFLDESKIDVLALKWFVLALHGALYNFMLVALVGSDLGGVWQKVERFQDGAINVFHENNRLISFLKAYELIKKQESMLRFVHSKLFLSTNKHDEAMTFLNNQLRNVFEHYQPIRRSMTREYIFQCSPVIDVLKFLILESGNVFLASNVITEDVERLIDKMQKDLT